MWGSSNQTQTLGVGRKGEGEWAWAPAFWKLFNDLMHSESWDHWHRDASKNISVYMWGSNQDMVAVIAGLSHCHPHLHKNWMNLSLETVSTFQH